MSERVGDRDIATMLACAGPLSTTTIRVKGEPEAVTQVDLRDALLDLRDCRKERNAARAACEAVLLDTGCLTGTIHRATLDQIKKALGKDARGISGDFQTYSELRVDLSRALADCAAMRGALESVAGSGDEIAEMAPHFIAARDVRSLTNYGGNIASVARAVLTRTDAGARMLEVVQHNQGDNMKPSIGRIVHYTNLGDRDGKYPPTIQAAVITGVNDDGSVSLHVFYKTGQFDLASCPETTHAAGSDAARGCWSWPARVE